MVGRGWIEYGETSLVLARPSRRWTSIQMGQWSETTTHRLCSLQPPRTSSGCPFECRRMWPIQLILTCSASVPICLAIHWVNIELDDWNASEWSGLLSDIELAHWLVFLWHPPIVVEPHELLRSPWRRITLSTELLIWSYSLLYTIFDKFQWV